MTKKTKLEGYHLSVRLTGDEKGLDGYMELINGMMLMTNMLVAPPIVAKSKNDDGTWNIHIELLLNKPPLGSMSLDDIPFIDDVFKDK